MTINAKPLAVVLLGLACGLIFFSNDIRIGVRVRAFDLIFLLVVVVFAWHILREGVSRETGPFLIAFGAFTLYSICNAALQVSLGTAIKELVQIVFFLLFFMALSQYVSNRQTTVLFLTTFLGALWLLALQNGFWHVLNGSYAGWKLLGDQKLTHSIIFVILVIVSISSLRPKRWWWVPLVVLGLVFLFLSGERKGWVAALVAITVPLMISDAGGMGGGHWCAPLACLLQPL